LKDWQNKYEVSSKMAGKTSPAIGLARSIRQPTIPCLSTPQLPVIRQPATSSPKMQWRPLAVWLNFVDHRVSYSSSRSQIASMVAELAEQLWGAGEVSGSQSCRCGILSPRQFLNPPNF
jgi:hypothetical protein